MSEPIDPKNVIPDSPNPLDGDNYTPKGFPLLDIHPHVATWAEQQALAAQLVVLQKSLLDVVASVAEIQQQILSVDSRVEDMQAGK